MNETNTPAMRRGIAGPPLIGLLVFIGFLLTAALLTYPLAWNPSGFLMKPTHYTNTWILGYEARAIFHDPLNIFDAPIFYPYGQTLAFSENLLGILPFFVPLELLSGSAVVAHNLLVVASFALAGLAAFLLVGVLLGLGFWPAALAGVVFAFCHYRFDHLPYLQLLWSHNLLFSLLFLGLFLKKSTWPRAAACGLFFMLQVLTSLYNALYLAALLLFVWAFAARGPGRGSAALYARPAVVFGIVVLLSAPLILPYVNVKQELGLARDYEDNVFHSADIKTLLAPSQHAKSLYAPLLGALWEKKEDGLFVGIVPLVLSLAGLLRLSAAIGRDRGVGSKSVLLFASRLSLIFYSVVIAASLLTALLWRESAAPLQAMNTALLTFIVTPLVLVLHLWMASRRSPLTDRLGCGVVAAGVLGLFLSFGPEVKLAGRVLGPGLYAPLYALAPALSAFRAPSRWFVLATIAVSVLAAYGLVEVARKFHGRRLAVLGFAAVALTIYEFSPAPVEYPAAAGYDLPEYRWLSRQEGDFAVLEFPPHGNPELETEYMLAQLVHGKRIVNGYSGFIVEDVYEELSRAAVAFPSDESWNILRRFPYRYLLVHENMLASWQRGEFRDLLRRPNSSFLKVRKRFDGVVILEVGKGAAGKRAVFKYPRRDEWLSFEAAALRQVPDRRQRLSLAVNGREYGSWGIGESPLRLRVELDEPPAAALPNTYAFSYCYEPSRPNRFAERWSLPFDLRVETGGDPNYCLVYLNGAFLPRAKGYNLYHVGPDGRLTAAAAFNTSWYVAAGAEMAARLDRLRGEQGYLLVVTRFDAARSLSGEAVEALGALGLTGDLRGRASWGHVALVKLGGSGVVFEKIGEGKISLGIGAYFPDSGFSLRALRTSATDFDQLAEGLP